MNEAMLSFLAIIALVAPFDLAWTFGIKAYRFIVDAFTGRNANI